jgi:tryptophanase
MEIWSESRQSWSFGWEWDKNINERNDVIYPVRFEVPRNAMADAHIDYAGAAIAQFHRSREKSRL